MWGYIPLMLIDTSRYKLNTRTYVMAIIDGKYKLVITAYQNLPVSIHRYHWSTSSAVSNLWKNRKHVNRCQYWDANIMSTVLKLGDSWGQYAGDRPNQVMDKAMWCQQVELQLHQMNDSFPWRHDWWHCSVDKDSCYITKSTDHRITFLLVICHSLQLSLATEWTTGSDYN